MSSDRLWKVTFALAGVLAAACLILGIAEVIRGVVNSTSEDLGGIVLLCGAGFLLLGGLFAFRSGAAWLGAAFITAGAIAGGMVLVWSVVALLIAVTLIVLSAVHARRLSTSSAT